MGPSYPSNKTNARVKEYVSFIFKVFPHNFSEYRKIRMLNDGRIICFDYLVKEIKLYKQIENEFMLDLEFSLVSQDLGHLGPTSMCEIEKGLILFGAFKSLDLFEIKNNKIEKLQKIDLNVDSYVRQIIKFSNGLIATYNIQDITIYKFDKENKKLEKVKDMDINGEKIGIWENNDNFYVITEQEIILYDINLNIIHKIKFPEKYGKWRKLFFFYFIDQYLLLMYQTETNSLQNKFSLDIITLKSFTVENTIELKDRMDSCVKLRDGVIVSADEVGNIHQFEINEKSQITEKDVFRGSEYKIYDLAKYDDNHILSIGLDGNVKLWKID